MSLWVDSHRPDTLSGLSYHEELTQQLTRLSKAEDLPHLLFYGPSGAGKKTRVNALLKEIFGPGVDRIHIDMREFTTPSNRKIDIAVLSSNFHMEINPSDVGIQDRLVIQTLIKEIAQTQQIDANSARKFKVIVISEADSLSKSAQQALRRTMEKYMSNLRLVLCANTTSKILSPIRSRCLLLRVAAPTIEQITEVLLGVAKKEGFSLPQPFASSIAQSSGRNLRKSLLMLETAHMQNSILSPTTTPPIPDWEIYVQQLALLIIREQSASNLLEVRNRLYELLTKCIPPSIILRTLSLELFNKVDDRVKGAVIQQAAFHEARMKEGSKFIVHLESFVAKFMSIYKRFLLESM